MPQSHYTGSDLRERVTLQEATPAAAGGGVVRLAWTNVKTLRAAVEPLSSNEYHHAQAAGSNVTHNVVIRRPVRRSGSAAELRPVPSMRLLHEGRALEITGAQELGRAWWLLRCKEVLT